jgi:hypothetical protein
MEAEILCRGDRVVEVFVDEEHCESVHAALGPHVKPLVKRIPRNSERLGIACFRLQSGLDASELTASLTGQGFRVVRRQFPADPQRKHL